MIEEVLSNKTGNDTVTDKMTSFYAPKSCVLNTLAQTYTGTNIHPKEFPPPPCSRSGVIKRAYSFLQASPTVPQTFLRSLKQGARGKSDWTSYEPSKTVDRSSCVLGVSGAPLGITTCQHKKRNSQNTCCFLIMLTSVWPLGYTTMMTKRESIFLNSCLGVTAEHIYFMLALFVYFW